jgi:tRNA(fMet)-specific endonuclease VapC
LNGQLLDTNVLIDLVFSRSPRLDQRFNDAVFRSVPLFLSTISLYEFRVGAEQSKRKIHQLDALADFLASVSVANFTSDDAESAALLKGTLAARGQIIGPYDLLIAGQALARGWTVVTGDMREFARVDGLEVEDWSVAPA